MLDERPEMGLLKRLQVYSNEETREIAAKQEHDSQIPVVRWPYNSKVARRHLPRQYWDGVKGGARSQRKRDHKKRA